ncbi:MAG TPA: glycosyl hydrolase [Solirubrobacterales bacterium]|nr:glycosyl hydrolase [Solirubrobacterales bacterium]
MLRKSRALALAMSLSLLALLTFATAAQAVPGTFWGVVPQGNPTEEQWSKLKSGGADSVRIPIDWGSIESAPNAFDLTEIDQLVKRTASAGLEMLPFISGAPSWAVPYANVPGTGGAKAPARLPVSGKAATAWSAMLRTLVRRYGPNGTLWAQNPTVPKRPIRNWQIWNEPNFHYFVVHPNPAEYGKLVKLSFAALRSADPRAQVILAGLFARPKGGKAKGATNPYASKFLQAMYETTPGIRTRFNAVALHPYTGKYQELTPEIQEFRKVLSDNHDAAKGLWITELGWSSQPPPANPLLNIFAKGLRGQARQLKGSFTLLRAKAAAWKVKRVYWFSVDDQPGACNFCDGSGLFKEGFVPKPAWTEFTRFAGGTP